MTIDSSALQGDPGENSANNIAGGSIEESNELSTRGIRPRRTVAWLGILLILVLLSEEVAYAFNLVTPALPQMAGQFEGRNIGWVSTVFTLTGAVTAPIIGKLADRYGKKRWLLIATACMAFGSLIVALSPSYEIVLAGRAIEGLGLSIIPITYSLMRDIFPRRLISMAVSIATAGIGVTSITGPFIAGYLIDNFGYQGVFFALGIYPILIGALILVAVPESPVRVKTSIDWIGGLLLGAAIGIMLYAVGEGATWGWTSLATIATFVLALVVGVIWIAYERRIPEPLIDLSVLRSRAVTSTLVTAVSSQAAIVLQFVLLAYIVQTPMSLGITYGLGQDAGYMARITTPGGVFAVAAGFAVGYIAEKRGARLPAWIGFASMTAGSFIIAFMHSSVGPILLGYCIFSVGSGLAVAAIPNLVIAATPVRLQAVTAGTVNVAGSLGSAVAVQICFTVLALNVVSVSSGQPIYAGSGFTSMYLVAAGITVVGLVASLVMRHGMRPQSIEARGIEK